MKCKKIVGIVVIIALIALASGPAYAMIRERIHLASVRCVDCHLELNYLINTGQFSTPELGQHQDSYLTSETINGLVLELSQLDPWMCDDCLYAYAKLLLGYTECLFPPT